MEAIVHKEISLFLIKQWQKYESDINERVKILPNYSMATWPFWFSFIFVGFHERSAEWLFWYFLLRSILLTIYKSFKRSHLDYGNFIFSSKIELVQYYAALAITGVIRISSREICYHELGLGHLHHRRWMRSFCSQIPLK